MCLFFRFLKFTTLSYHKTNELFYTVYIIKDNHSYFKQHLQLEMTSSFYFDRSTFVYYLSRVYF